MTKDEMKNRISMALKNSTLQQGFEIICKNLAELEKENAGLKARRPEWHKVADGDLPPTSGEMHAERYPILACTKNGYVTVAIRRKHGRAYEWFCSDYDGNTLYLDKEVIAWCEIPKYTEE